MRAVFLVVASLLFVQVTRAAAPARPNVLLIISDDQGYGVSDTFGGVIPTPAMDRIGQWDFAIRNSIQPRCVRRRGLH